MTCHEVMDLMQRDLDGDLGEEEYDRMLAHLAGCEECADMYKRLQQLHLDLASLPKVTPTYSLVDAILPKLADLDGAVAPEAASVAAPEVRPTAVRRSTLWLRWAGGAAAACVAALVLWQTGMPEKLQQADSLLSNTARKESAAAGTSAPASSPESAMRAKMMDQAGAGDMLTYMTSAPKGSADQADVRAKTSEAPAVGSGQGQAAAGQQAPSSTAPPVSAGTPSPAPTLTTPPRTEQPAVVRPPVAVPEQPAKTESGAPDMGMMVMPPQESSSSSDGGLLMAPVQAVSKGDASKSAPQLPSKGISFDAAIIAAQEIDSPNGTLTALIKSSGDKRYVAIVASSGGSVRFDGGARFQPTDTIVLGRWESETVFRYSVRSGGTETARTYSIDVRTGRETEVRS